MTTAVRPGDLIDIYALHADGAAYRWWRETVETIDDEKIVTIAPAGRDIYGPSRAWILKYAMRNVYWPARPYVLVEMYRPDGALHEVYVHVASPPTLEGHRLTYVDYELDVVLKPGGAPEVVDEDEFAEAAGRYGYTPEFQERCQRVVAEVLDLIVRWESRGMPGGDDPSDVA
jgi:protein associated with RNAse G/E